MKVFCIHHSNYKYTYTAINPLTAQAGAEVEIKKETIDGFSDFHVPGNTLNQHVIFCINDKVTAVAGRNQHLSLDLPVVLVGSPQCASTLPDRHVSAVHIHHPSGDEPVHGAPG